MPDNRANCFPQADDAFAFALSIQGRKRVHNADELRAEIVAKRVFCRHHLARAVWHVANDRAK